MGKTKVFVEILLYSTNIENPLFTTLKLIPQHTTTISFCSCCQVAAAVYKSNFMEGLNVVTYLWCLYPEQLPFMRLNQGFRITQISHNRNQEVLLLKVSKMNTLKVFVFVF